MALQDNEYNAHLSELDKKARLDHLEAEKANAEAEIALKRKNNNFTQVYPAGWRRVRQLAKKNPSAAILYSFFAENLDPTCGAVICDQQFLADQFDVTTRTIRRWIAYLEEELVIVKIPVGTVYAYALNPSEVWKGYNTSKDYAAFRTKTLVNKDQSIQRRIMSMFKDKDSNK